MSIIPSNYLAYAREWENKSLDQTVTVVYYTTSTCYGNVRPSGCTTTTYDGRLWQTSGREMLDPSKMTEFSGWKLALPHSACISASCDVWINSVRYNVRFSDKDKSNNAATVVDLERAR